MSELLAERDGEILVLTLNRAGKANALNEALQDALVERLLNAKESTTAVVLAAAGEPVFSAGADLKEFAELERGAAARKRRTLLKRTLEAILAFPKPLVAAVRGKALGAGCMIALLADELVMAEGSELGLPEIKHGIPTPVGYAIVAARAGMAVARRMVQRGVSVAAKEARFCGLADEIVATGKLKGMALERARALAAAPGASFAANKAFMNGPLRAALKAAFAEADRL